MKLYYLGPAGSFTHIAALDFNKQTKLIPSNSIEESLAAVKKNKLSFGIVPVENSVEGVVLRTLDLILEKNLTVFAEINLPILQHLLSREKSIDAIKTIYSHPHAFAQARKFLDKYAPNAAFKETPSTSAAAIRAQREPNSAAIGSEQAAKLYDLKIVARGIHNGAANITRFWIVGTRGNKKFYAGESQELIPQTKTSCYILVRDKVGALKNVLDSFFKNNVSLSFIQSRPIPNELWRYGFFIDLLADANDPMVKKMFRFLKQEHPLVQILGSYPEYGAFNRKAVFAYNLNRISSIFSPNQKHPLLLKTITNAVSYLDQSIKLKAELKKILTVRCYIMPSFALYKHKNNQPIPDKKREQALLQKFRKYDNLYNLYTKIFTASKNIQIAVVRGIKKRQIKKNDIHRLSLKDLRYYIDYLDSLVYESFKHSNPTTKFKQ